MSDVSLVSTHSLRSGGASAERANAGVGDRLFRGMDDGSLFKPRMAMFRISSVF